LFFQRAKRSANHAIIIDFCRESSVFFFASHLLQLQLHQAKKKLPRPIRFTRDFSIKSKLKLVLFKNLYQLPGILYHNPNWEIFVFQLRYSRIGSVKAAASSDQPREFWI
jgi:hypothetical protein